MSKGLFDMAHVIRAARAWVWRWRQGDRRGSLPCLRCAWWHDDTDPEAPWQWISCECEWGNQ